MSHPVCPSSQFSDHLFDFSRTWVRMSNPQSPFAGPGMPSHTPLAVLVREKAVAETKHFIEQGASTNGMDFTPPSCTHRVSSRFPEVCFIFIPQMSHPPEPGLEGSCESHISPRNSGKGTPAFNEEKIFFFSADFHSQANKNGKQ